MHADSARVVISVGRGNRWKGVLSVFDCGPGFPRSIGEAIFEPFFSTNRKEPEWAGNCPQHHQCAWGNTLRETCDVAEAPASRFWSAGGDEKWSKAA